MHNEKKTVTVTMYHLLYDNRTVEIVSFNKMQMAAFKRSFKYKKLKPFVTKLTTVTISYCIKLHNLK